MEKLDEAVSKKKVINHKIIPRISNKNPMESGIGVPNLQNCKQLSELGFYRYIPGKITR